MKRFTIEHRVPWADVDLAKIVYFPRYFSYFEIAELEWYRQQALSYESILDEMDVWMPRVAAHCNYRSPARLAELLSIEMHLKRLGRTSYTFGFNAYRLPERKPLADGHIVIATVGRESFQATPVPAKLVRLLEGLPLESDPE